MNPMRLVTSSVAAIGVVALLAYLSAAPVPYHSGETARLRLSWSARPERIEVCRTLSEEELELLAEHMRQRVSCEGEFASYTLRIAVDGTMLDESVVRGAGLRNDRPLFLLRDYPVPPGTHRLQISLTRREIPRADTTARATIVRQAVDTGRYAGRAQREANERSRLTRAAIPASLTLDTVLNLTPRRVALVTFNVERRTLQLRAESLNK